MQLLKKKCALPSGKYGTSSKIAKWSVSQLTFSVKHNKTETRVRVNCHEKASDGSTQQRLDSSPLAFWKMEQAGYSVHWSFSRLWIPTTVFSFRTYMHRLPPLHCITQTDVSLNLVVLQRYLDHPQIPLYHHSILNMETLSWMILTLVNFPLNTKRGGWLATCSISTTSVHISWTATSLWARTPNQ